MKYYLALDIGCLECGESSSIIGVYKTEEEANKVIENYRDIWHRWGKEGRHGEHLLEEIFEVEIPKD